MSFALAMAASRSKTDEELYNTSIDDRFFRNAETGKLALGLALKRPKFPVSVEVLNAACVACDLERTLEYWRTIAGFKVSRIKCGCGVQVEVIQT